VSYNTFSCAFSIEKEEAELYIKLALYDRKTRRAVQSRVGYIIKKEMTSKQAYGSPLVNKIYLHLDEDEISELALLGRDDIVRGINVSIYVGIKSNH
jgi:hypothetical protein